MLVSIYFFLAFLFLALPIAFILLRQKYLGDKVDTVMSEEGRDGHALFLEMSRATTRFFLRKVSKYLKFAWHYLLHILVKVSAAISGSTDMLYEKLRNKFVHTTVASKSSVPHFWDSLKKYKREIDEEKEKIEDESISFIQK